MSKPESSPGAVPHSSGRNRYATHRAVFIVLVVLAFLFAAMFVPW